MVSPEEAFTISAFAQAVLYGLYLVTWLYALRWLLLEDVDWKFRARHNINWLMVIPTILIFVLSSVDLSLSIRIPFALLRGETLSPNKLEATTIIIETTIILITDGVLIFRCWLVYAKSWCSIALPVVLWLTCLTCTITFNTWLFLDLHDANFLSLFTPRARRVAGVYFCCNLINNFYTTSAISYKIFKHAKGVGSGSLLITCRIVAESGIICAITSCAMIITSALFDGASIPVLVGDVINFSMTGIAFNLILIRVGQLRTANPNYCVGIRDETTGLTTIPTWYG